MRIQTVEIRNYPPISQLKAEELSNIVVFAGPNGVGKTRLIQALLQAFQNPAGTTNVKLQIAATSESEKKAWESNVLDTSQPSDAQKLARTLRRGQKRGGWRSSAIQYDSNRQFRTVKPVQWTWMFADPMEEAVNWNFLLQPFMDRFQDTLHALYRMLGRHRAEIAKKAIQLKRAGETHMDLDFADPLEKFKEIFELLLGPKKLAELDLNQSQLRYLQDENPLPIDTLSSGEKEAFSMAFDLLLRSPEDCIVLVDEPELHLHPELSFRLLKTLQTIGARNQFILCTHSADIVSASIEHSVVFISPRPRDGNQGILIKAGDETVTALKELGQSLGVISLGRKIILIEGSEKSIDRDTIGAIIHDRFPGLVLAPSGSRQSILSFARIIEEILDKTIWGIEFFMLADRDSSIPGQRLEELETKSRGRLKFLPRYHIENYFLDETTIAESFRDLEPTDSWLRDSPRVRERLVEIARMSIPLSVNLWLSTQIGSLIGEIDISLKDVLHKDIEKFVGELRPRRDTEWERLASHLDPTNIEKMARERWGVLEKSLEDPGDRWKYDFPGKLLIAQLASQARIKKGHFRTSYIAAAKRKDMECFQEIIEIFEKFEVNATTA